MWYQPTGGIFNKDFLIDFKKYVPHKETIKQVDFIERVLKLKPGMKVLDLACGWGRHSIELALRGYKVTGIDINPLYLREAERRSSRLNLEVKWVKKDMRRISFENKFNAVLNLSNSFGYFKKERSHERVIENVSRALKPGGKFLIDFLNLESFIYHYQPERIIHFGKDCFSLLKSSFDFLKSRWKAEEIVFRQNKKRKTMNYDLRAFTVRELISLCQKSGLKFKAVYDGGFEGKPLTFDSRHCILITQKPYKSKTCK